MKTIDQAWREFSELIPRSAPDLQRREMKRAFYCGFATMFQFGTYDIAQMGEEDGPEALVSIEAQLRNFQEAVARGEA